LIIRHVECLTAGQQITLAAWLRRSADVQIISVAGMPVFPLVREGTFLEELYYLLNVVLLEVGGDPTPRFGDS
jgi:DNA-binding NtrC family response regulator